MVPIKIIGFSQYGFGNQYRFEIITIKEGHGGRVREETDNTDCPAFSWDVAI